MSDDTKSPWTPLSEEERKSITSDIIHGLTPQWGPAPEGAVCPKCQSALERSTIPLGGPFSGSVRCTSCDYTDSVTGHLVRSCFMVEPLDPTDDPSE